MRSRDRLAELRHLANGAAGGEHQDTEQPGGEPPPPHPKEIGDTLHEVQRLLGWIRDLELQTQVMRGLHAQPTFHTSEPLQERAGECVSCARAAGLKAGGALRELQARAQGLRACCDAPARIAHLHASACRALYHAALSAHHAALDELRDSRLRLLRDQLKLTGAEVRAEEEEEWSRLLEERRVSVFVGSVREESAEARRVLRDAEARRGELARVEGALRDVRELFLQLAHLVAAQQDHVDTVEHHALRAGDHVGQGQHHLLRGTTSRARGRKKKLSLALCLAVGVLVLVLVLALT